MLFVAIISPSRRFGVGDDDPIEPIGDGRELGPDAPVAALIVFEEGYAHGAWTAATTLHAIEPRIKISTVRIPSDMATVASGVDAVSLATADAIPHFLSQHEGKTVAIIALRTTSSDLVGFYRPFGHLMQRWTSHHSLFACDSSEDGAKGLDSLSTALFIVRSSEQSDRFWRRVRRSMFNPKTYQWTKQRSLAAAVHHVRRSLVSTNKTSGGGGDPRLGSIGCLPTSTFVRARPPTEGKAVAVPPAAPAACIVSVDQYGPQLLDHLPTDYRHRRLASFFTLVERECGTLEWDGHASATNAAALRELREEQHLSRSAFSTVDATALLKGDVIAVQLPHTTEMPLARWATTSSLRAAEPSFRLYLVNPNSTTGRDPTPSASMLADFVDEWQRVSPASSTFVWISGPAVAFAPFVDTLSLTLHREAPAILIGTCENVQLVVAKNDPPGAAAQWLRQCSTESGGGVDHTTVYVLGNPLNGTSRDEDGTFIVPADQPIVIERPPSDEARVCIMDDPRYVKALAVASAADLTANATQDVDAFIASVGTRCGSPGAARMHLGPWAQHDGLAGVLKPTALLQRVSAATKQGGSTQLESAEVV